eukprot:scaffold118722_cov60-Phaeocystis_antarctica.AAC.2
MARASASSRAAAAAAASACSAPSCCCDARRCAARSAASSPREATACSAAATRVAAARVCSGGGGGGVRPCRLASAKRAAACQSRAAAAAACESRAAAGLAAGLTEGLARRGKPLCLGAFARLGCSGAAGSRSSPSRAVRNAASSRDPVLCGEGDGETRRASAASSAASRAARRASRCLSDKAMSSMSTWARSATATRPCSASCSAARSPSCDSVLTSSPEFVTRGARSARYSSAAGAPEAATECHLRNEYMSEVTTAEWSAEDTLHSKTS